MKFIVNFVLVMLVIFFVSEQTSAYYPEISWKNKESLMTGDLRHRMMKKIPTRRRYCDCKDYEDNYPVCASNGALYENECLFQCAQIRSPHLEEVDIAACGSETFKEFKQNEFRPHY